MQLQIHTADCHYQTSIRALQDREEEKEKHLSESHREKEVKVSIGPTITQCRIVYQIYQKIPPLHTLYYIKLSLKTYPHEFKPIMKIPKTSLTGILCTFV